MDSSGKVAVIAAISATKKDGTARTAIEPSAYRDKGFTSAVIPDSVESIAEFAFHDNKLTSVMLGNRRTSKLKIIEGFAFANNKLTSVTIPDSVTKIEQGVFTGNPDLKTVTLKKSLYNKIKARSGGLSEVFGTQVTRYNIVGMPKTITASTYGNQKFTALPKNLPHGLTHIGANAFKDNKLDSHLDLLSLNGLTNIGNGAFAGNGITIVTFPCDLHHNIVAKTIFILLELRWIWARA